MKKEDAAVTKLYDLEHTVAAPLLESVTYPWEALPEIKAYILKVGALLPKEDYLHPSEDVWIHKTAKVFPSA
ncbi:MAG: UDP-N-acetylglucosamine pyrophosphorylase, partial [Lachnospiraceae bacterium]|nr:UDP-N-acetylglucosamine pyrophosphorylase [Lachnospiraceae bacterium]